MLRLSWRTFTQRWQLFVGATLTVCLGVALVQSSLLILISVATADVPAGLSPLAQAQLQGGYTSALAMLGLTLALSIFLAVFIVSSTFAFTVAQRRRDLALLRLIGGGRVQLRRLLLGEALLLGLIGSACGVPLGLLVMRAQATLLHNLGFLPAMFVPSWQDWILGVSGGLGVGVAIAGVLVAARRASRVRPLEALRATGAVARVMTPSRWIIGLLFLAGAMAMAIVAGFAGLAGATALSLTAAMAAAVGLSALSPIVVPLIGKIFGTVLRGSTLGGLAEANLADGVRRSASTAAPLLVLVALVIGQAGTMASVGAATEQAQRSDIAGDLVVSATGPAGDRIAEIPGVAVAAEAFIVPVTITRTERDDDGVERETELEQAMVIDPAEYQRVHTAQLQPGAGLDAAMITAIVGNRELPLQIEDTLQPTMGSGATFLLPPGVLPAGLLADTASRTIVQVADGVRPGTVAASIRAAGIGDVQDADTWIVRNAAAQQQTQTGITTVLLGLAGLYALLAVINAIMIAAAERKEEFAIARLAGLRRGQVVRAALIESWAVTAIGLVLGAAGAAASLLAIGSALDAIGGFATIVVPWPLVGAVVAGAFAIVGAASVLTSLTATRRRPVTFASAGG